MQACISSRILRSKTPREKFAAIGVEKGQSKGKFFVPDELENLSQYRRKKKGEKM